MSGAAEKNLNIVEYRTNITKLRDTVLHHFKRNSILWKIPAQDG
jgi:hypothetical protein